jgi:hypothetical protein
MTPTGFLGLPEILDSTPIAPYYLHDGHWKVSSVSSANGALEVGTYLAERLPRRSSSFFNFLFIHALESSYERKVTE